MSDDAPDSLPLKERLRKASYLSRELSEHLTQAYLPKLADLRLSAKEFDANNVSDQQVFDQTVAVLEAEEFTDQLYLKLNRYLSSIRNEMDRMLFTENDSSESSASMRRPESRIDGTGLFE